MWLISLRHPSSVHFIIHKLKEFMDQGRIGPLPVSPRVRSACPFEPVPYGSPLVFLNQQAPVKTEAQVELDEFLQTSRNHLEKEQQWAIVSSARVGMSQIPYSRVGYVAMHAHVPPDPPGLSMQFVLMRS